MRRTCLMATALFAALPATASAGGAPQTTLAGTCQFSGQILPEPPITALPGPSPHFSYDGTGTCSGVLGTRPIKDAPLHVIFSHASTPFDTCELGLDLGLQGTMEIPLAHHRLARFRVTIDLVRLAVAGPMRVSTTGGGDAFGTAQFSPADPAAAVLACGGAGIGSATLSGNFKTRSPLVGKVVRTPSANRSGSY